MPPPVRERYNAKARGSVAGGSHKSRKRKSKVLEPEEFKPVQPHHEPGMSSKKRKRLDSYIHKKLQLERRDETLQKLAALQSNEASMSMLSSAGLGQNPLAPTTALQRAEIAEDRAVRRGIDKLKRRHGEANSESEEEQQAHIVTTTTPGQEEIETTVLETKAERKAREKAQARGSGKLTMPKKAGWNPALKKKDGEESSDFDSSDSGEDSESDGEASTSPRMSGQAALPTSETGGEPVPKPATGSALKHSVGSALKPSPGSALKSVAGSALKSQAGSALKANVGGALKTAADGSVYKPRVVTRGPKKFAPARQRQDSSDAGSDDDDSSDDGSDDDDGSDSDDDIDEDEDEELESDDEEEDGSDDDGEAGAVTAPKRKNFKEWALKQMGSTEKQLAPDLLSAPVQAKNGPALKVGSYVAPMGAAYEIPTSSLLTGNEGAAARPMLKRRPSVTEARMELPILAEEQAIVEAVRMHPVVIICGETGSGKTTQVPQMLYEAGFGYKGSENAGMVAVTQPRRVAAVSLAERVRDELGFSPSSGVVAHQIRYSSTTAPDTAIKFMTDGVLLRELANDFLLSRYSVVVVDEAHERGVNTDVLIGVLSRVARLREKRWRETTEGEKLSPLRLVIMSATLRVADFAENSTLFATPPPIIHIGARQHPVTIHFSRRTVSDYVGEAYKKVCKIHSRLPPGTVLVFLTGQSEIMGLCRRLEAKFGDKSKDKGKGKPKTRGKEGKWPTEEVEDDGRLKPEVIEAEDVELGGVRDLAADVDDGVAESDDEALDTDEEDDLMLEDTDMPITVLPLYSLLSQDAQMAVFRPPPEGHRLVIVATNVAETSLTIPGVRYVVDSGRAKERQYDHASGVQTFAVSWISKASAAQRAGRAGRTGPGHCYRLYSSALYEDHFPAFGEPEILRMPIEGVVLNMKAMNIDAVINFPFPTPPDRQALRRAEALLTHLGALDKASTTKMVAGVQHAGSKGGKITDLGRAMAAYPVSPRFAKMLAVGRENGCLAFVIAIVAGLSVGDPFVHENALEDDGEEGDREAELEGITSESVRAKERRRDVRSRFFKRHAAFDSGESDMFKLLAAIGAYEHTPTAHFCAEYFLRPKAMQEIQQLRGQICRIAAVPLERMSPPSDKERKILRQILCAGFIDQVAVLESLATKKGSSAHASARGIAYRALGVPEPVYLHPSSVLFHHTPPDYVVFSEVVRTARVCLKGVTKVQGSWLAVLGKDMCTFSRPLETPGMRAKSVTATEREVIVVPHFGDLGVDLPPIKRRQRREGTRWVTLDE
ncbi:P-loop containing nucleoside triphosphate hydrolase protein [Cutaneotrichosporon oleaginosum]|uniref:RNA helicase n=1 Tax=Cutaneotrichosporon oleaginosum TaxID=879819 RepID=A0A0J0XMY9_9TREE|nr:P-loop containing nucleoside triphosphate hydrolase protein [Cutaneotrichosporon oleaginosum]KLT42475.1 P-loop containing nucleoside triphosphate hydrolase protein [Cutaneotrichosporon oleaginosum]TXT06994.1 hypothetical protein COLE_06325 [Cutaneotrichosporon oleaginosum]